MTFAHIAALDRPNLDGLEGAEMETETRDSLLSGWLGMVPSQLAEAILTTSHLKSFESGTRIHSLGDPHLHIYGVAKGLVQMWFTLNEQDPKFGHIVGRGFWFGETAVLTGQSRMMDAIATGRVELLLLSGKQIESIAIKRPEIWKSLALLTALNQGTAIGVADDLMIRNSKERLAATLLRLSSRRSAFQKVAPLDALPISWDELSHAANLSRSKVGALLSEFSERGFIKTNKRSIEFLNPQGLIDLLDEAV